jgi:hypothetical protein
MVEALVEEVLHDPRTVGEAAVQEVAVHEVFEQGPGGDAAREECRHRQTVRGAESPGHQRDGIGRVQHGRGIKPATRFGRLAGPELIPGDAAGTVR